MLLTLTLATPFDIGTKKRWAMLYWSAPNGVVAEIIGEDYTLMTLERSQELKANAERDGIKCEGTVYRIGQTKEVDLPQDYFDL